MLSAPLRPVDLRGVRLRALNGGVTCLVTVGTGSPLTELPRCRALSLRALGEGVPWLLVIGTGSPMTAVRVALRP